jgi:hypothetical protein
VVQPGHGPAHYAADLHPAGGFWLPAEGHAELVDRGGYRMAGTLRGLSDDET